MSKLEQIIATGTQNGDFTRTGRPSGHIVCKDGFKLSVQAGAGMYCTPRPDFGSLVTRNPGPSGPYTAVEVGFPSVRPEPWESWREWVEDEDRPTDTVYACVPVSAVADLIELHGGEA